jgi:hypothetical protein
MKPARSVSASIAALVVLASAGACGGSENGVEGPEPSLSPVSSYDGPHAEPPSPPVCAPESPVDSQAELNALEGCEVAVTWLYIDFAFADLRPLYALRVAEQGLGIGGYPVASLEGLERLERASLILRNFTGRDLRSLASLRSVELGAEDGPRQAGDFTLLYGPELESLAGLEGLAFGAGGLEIAGTPRLVSLSPLELPERLDSVAIVETPLLTDITAFSALQQVGFLLLRETGIQTLDALQHLRSAVDLYLVDNPALVDASGLGNLESAAYLEAHRNPMLRSLPAFPRLAEVIGISIGDNASLESIDSFAALTELPRLSIVNNPKLTSIAAGPELESIARLVIARNEGLSSLSFPALATVRSYLVVASNPLLPAEAVAPFEQLDVPSRKVLGNRDDVVTIADGECPWERDDFCDEEPGATFCAPGTDRLDCGY